MAKITDVRCDNKINPIGIDKAPLFSWKIESDNSFLQKSYRIIVSKNGSTVFDTKEVVSNSTCGIEYFGEKLESKTLYSYTIEVTGLNGGSLISEKATFETGLIGGFSANWIGMPAHFCGNALFVRNNKRIYKKIIKARMYICGLGYYEAYINGKKVGNSVLNPGFTDYSKRVLYDTYDVTDYYNNEFNITCVMLGQGWFGSRQLICEIDFYFEDGTTDNVNTGYYFDWFITKAPIISQSIYEGEIYDARREKLIDGYDGNGNEIDYFSNGWMFSVSAESPKGIMQSQFNEPIEKIREIKYKQFNKIENNKYIYDFGQIFAGWVKIEVKGKAGDKVTLKFAEGINADGSISQLNLRSADCTDVYILKGEGDECYQPRFTYHGFQYVEVTVSENTEILSINGILVRNAVRKTGEFKCSDKIINQIHNNTVWTEESNMHSIPTDCPQRDERFGWLNDITSRLDQALYNFDVYQFYKKFLYDINDAQDEDGAIGDTAPFKIGMKPADPVVICYLLIPLKIYQVYGDKALLRDNYTYIKKWVEYLKANREDGLLKFGYYGDWSPPLEFSIDGTPCNRVTPVETVSAAYFYWYANTLSKIAEIIDEKEDSIYYLALAEETKALYNKTYFNYEKRYYNQNSQSGNAIPLNLGICEDKYRDSVIKNIIEDVVKRDHHLTTGNQGYKHMLEVMTESGFVDDMFELVVNQSYPGWGYMIAQGATTIWERWESEMKNLMNSFCHPMLGSVDAWFYKYLAGISISEEACGADKITIKPYIIKHLEFVECKFETVRGVIVSNWKKDGKFIEYYIEIPNCTIADIFLPGNVVSINGESVKAIEILNPGKYNIICKID